jgi:hypothetical protein
MRPLGLAQTVPLLALLLAACTHVRLKHQALPLEPLKPRAVADPAVYETLRVTETRPGRVRVGADWYSLRALKAAATRLDAHEARRACNRALTLKALRDILPPVSVGVGAGVGMGAVALSGLNDGPPLLNDSQRGALFAAGLGLGLLAAAVEWPLLNRRLDQATEHAAQHYNKALAQHLQLGVAPLPGGAEARLKFPF